MGEAVDIFMAQMFRKNPEQPWGFRIEGGYNSGQPLTISLVANDSPAGLIGLQPGDVITKIFSRPTKFLTYNQAADIIASIKSNDLILTIERKAFGNEEEQHEAPQDFQQQQHQQPHQQHQQFHIYQPQQTFKGSAHIQLTSSPQSSSPVIFTKQQHQILRQPPQRPQPPQTRPQPPPQKYASNYDDNEEVIPQSRTFRRLQNFMESKHPPLGAAGLPPPRSLSMELQRNQNQNQSRVKVIMSQKYNSPLGMYSAENIVDTFSSQVGSILDSLEE